MITHTDARPWRRTKGGRPGFTAVEIIFVMIIAGVLMSLALPAFREFRTAQEVMNARHAFMMQASRARAAAVERGEPVVLMVRIYRDSVFVMSPTMADTIEIIDYRGGETQADILLDNTPAPFRLCYMPRGFVHPSCLDAEYLPARIGFTTWSGADTAWAVINAVGQVEPL